MNFVQTNNPDSMRSIATQSSDCAGSKSRGRIAIAEFEGR